MSLRRAKKQKTATIDEIAIEESVGIDNAYLYLPLLLGCFAYFFVHVNYNIYYLDDAWVLSNVWNMTKLGIGKDLVFINAGDSGHVQYFGMTYAFIIGHVMDFIGWTKSNAFLVNSVFVWGTAFVWYHILKKLPFSKNTSKLTAIFLPLFPPFFFAAHSGRPEAFIGFLVSIQLLLFIRKRYFLAAFITGIAFEAHIMGFVGLFFLLAYAIYKQEEIRSNKKEVQRLFLYFTLGGIAAFGYYFALHGNHFSFEEILGIISGKRDMNSPLNSYILNYFMNYDWYSRVWEFALFLGALGLYFKKGMVKKNRFLTILLIVVLISTVVTRRENKNYFVYIFPAFIILYFFTFEQLKRLKQFVAVLSVAMIIYYGGHFYFNGSYDFERITLEVKETLKEESLPIVGIPDFWFANMENSFIPIHYRKLDKLYSVDDFYLIQSDYLEWRCKIYEKTMNYYKSNYNTTLVKEIAVYGEKKISIWKCDKQEPGISEQ